MKKPRVIKATELLPLPLGGLAKNKKQKKRSVGGMSG